jgi:hypothetical protein
MFSNIMVSGKYRLVIKDNGLVYGLLRGLAHNLANKNRIENHPRVPIAIGIRK